MVINIPVLPLEGGHLPYKKGEHSKAMWEKEYLTKKMVLHRLGKHVMQLHSAFFKCIPADLYCLKVEGIPNSYSDSCKDVELGTNQMPFKGGFRLEEI